MNAADPAGTPSHAIVVGSGFGGLAAAVRLGARGYRVTVLDRLEAPGGRASVFRQDGFVFDAGPTIITAPFLFEELWALCGRRLEDDVTLVPMDPFYRIRFDDGTHIDYNGDPEAMRERVAALAPDDVDGYERYLAFSERVYKVGFDGLVDRSFHRLATMLSVVPDLVRLSCWRSVYAQVSRFVRSEKLRQVLSFHPLLVGGDPLHTPAIYTLISHLERAHGVHFALGGTGALVDGLVNLIEGQGGTVRCNAEVTRIRSGNGRATGVELEGGERLDADLVVFNGDPMVAYTKLLDGPRKRWTPGKVRRARPSMSLFVWYFGTDRQWPDVPHHLILLGPRYRGLLEDIFGRLELAEDFSLYLHRPTATDASLAPAGGDAFYVLSPVPHLGADVDWEETAERYRAAIAAHLDETVLPGLQESLVSSRMLTPIDFETRYLSWQGAGFALEPRLLQSAWFRPHNRSEELDDLYLVGAGTHPGAGLPGVISSAKVLDEVVPPPRVPRPGTHAAAVEPLNLDPEALGAGPRP